ncbi:MAG: pyrimidine dimer DNA glycosylase/endonuclease V [Desulfopila sp.]
MRIWDINPGYLNRQSLLGEHRELHGIVSILVNNKSGYSRHPETLRWLDCGWALSLRHQLLAAEMSLRNFTEKSPVSIDDSPKRWPEGYN